VKSLKSRSQESLGANAALRHERDLRVAGQLSVEAEEPAEGVVIGHAHPRARAPAAAPHAQHRHEGPAILDAHLDAAAPALVTGGGLHVVKNPQGAQAREVRAQLIRVERSAFARRHQAEDGGLPRVTDALDAHVDAGNELGDQEDRGEHAQTAVAA